MQTATKQSEGRVEAPYKYKYPDKYLILNQGDPDLVPVVIDMDWLLERIYKEFGFEYIPPEPQHIYGYGIDPKDQKFEREEVPDKLVNLESRLRKRQRKSKETFIKREIDTMNMFWEELAMNQELYAKEIAWIETMWYYRLLGKWIYINGKATYLTGWQWYYLNFWHLDNVLPEYRDRDRRWFIAQKYTMLETRTFKKMDRDGYAIPEYDGTYKFKDLNRRVFYGANNPKSRRVGDTSKTQCISSEIITRSMKVHHGIQGKDDDNASNVFNHHFVGPYKKMPIFFRPLAEALDPRTEMIFDNDDPEIGLGSRCDFATSSDRQAYDGYKLNFYHRDEPGKIKLEDIRKSHKVVKQCCSLGDKIIGFMVYTTTVEEMNRRGGENYLKITKESHWNQRDKNGQTLSGLVNWFFPAYDGLEGFVGPYGESVIGDPTEEQAHHIGKLYGSKEFLDNKRQILIQNKDIEGLSEEKRLYPQTFRECFTPPAANTFFRTDILEATINKLQFDDKAWVTGNFYWIDKGAWKVGWKVDEEFGRFHLSKQFPPETLSRSMIVDGRRQPVNPNRGIISADAFRVEKTDSDRMSDGAIVAFWRRDEMIDPPDKPVEQWESHRFILSYRNRPDTTKEFSEDVLMAAIYLGFLVYPESNVDKVITDFKEWNAEGYLLYDTDPDTGDLKNNPGYFTNDAVKVAIFNYWRDHIRIHGHRERHMDILGECLAIPNRDKMKDFDLFSAGGGCFLGLQSLQGVYMDTQQKSEGHDTTSWFGMYSYGSS